MGLAIIELARERKQGMIAIVTVSGLHDEEDHKIIIDALKGKFFKRYHII